MSLFTKRRLKIRQKQEEDRKRWNESSKRIDKSMNDMVEAMKQVITEHPDYENLDKDEKVKLFAKYYNKIHNKI